ncbi:transmembrane protein 225 [Saccopteryx bilineata]|uniref:transmembrane protein 225 n=1 Tax=Saccopteryx bilineata TaxID=59482 RepID=UPI00338E57FF
MVHISIRKLQAINMLLSSLVLVFLVFGIFTDEWASLKVEGADNMKRQNPWLVSTIWPNDDLKAVRIMMYLILGLSCYHNFFLGLEFTYMVTPTKCVFFITIFTSISTGVFLISALLLYHLKLQQGLFVYYSYFKFTWVIFTAYLSASFLIASGSVLTASLRAAAFSPGVRSPGWHIRGSQRRSVAGSLVLHFPPRQACKVWPLRHPARGSSLSPRVNPMPRLLEPAGAATRSL